MQKITKLLKRSPIVAILMFGLILRFIVLNQSLWHDEAIGALVVRDMSIKEMFNGYLVVDNHPPLYYLILKLQTLLFGFSEISLRFPSVIVGMGTIYLTYKIAKLYDEKGNTPIVSSLLLATSQLHIYYSQEARMYALTAFLVCLYFYIHLLISKNIKFVSKAKLFVFLSIAFMLIFSSDYPASVVFIIVFIDLLIKREKPKTFFTYAFTVIPSLLFLLFWFPYFLKQISGGSWLVEKVPSWKQLAGGVDFYQLRLLWTKFTGGRVSFVNKPLYGAYIATTSLIYFGIVSRVNIKLIQKYKTIFLWFFGGAGLVYLISFIVPAFIYFRLLFILPAFYILIAALLGQTKTKTVSKIITFLLITINLFSTGVYYFNQYTQREQWRQAVNFIETFLSKDNIAVFSYPEPFSGYRWYEKHPEYSFGLTDSIAPNKVQTQMITENTIKDKKSVYYFEYLRDLSDTDSVVVKSIESFGFTKKNTYSQFVGIGNIYFFENNI